jgi:hypothetical protein
MACLSIGLAAGLSLSACGTGAEAQGPAPTTPATGQQPDLSYSAIELAVLEAINYDNRAKAARYEPDAGRVVVTIFPGDEPISDLEIQAYEVAAEAVSGDLDIVIEISDVDPPQEY